MRARDVVALCLLALTDACCTPDVLRRETPTYLYVPKTYPLKVKRASEVFRHEFASHYAIPYRVRSSERICWPDQRVCYDLPNGTIRAIGRRPEDAAYVEFCEEFCVYRNRNLTWMLDNETLSNVLLARVHKGALYTLEVNGTAVEGDGRSYPLSVDAQHVRDFQIVDGQRMLVLDSRGAVTMSGECVGQTNYEFEIPFLLIAPAKEDDTAFMITGGALCAAASLILLVTLFKK